MSVVVANAECPLVVELSNCLKEDSRSGIVSCLTRIKTDDKCSKRLFENGGVCLLVELLRYRNTKVMDATLSILANACLLSHVREKVEGTKIASYVVWITKNLQSGETMHCRACRLMGNLSESRNHARALCDAGAVVSLTEILRSRANNAQTLGMAVRAIRNIWRINESGRDEILEAGTIREILKLLVRSRKRIIERTIDAKYEDLAESCLKAICVFSDCTDSRTREQIRGEREIDGYRCIVDYCRDSNKIAIKCLYKLCRDAGRRPDLGNSGAIECLIDYIVTFENSQWRANGERDASPFAVTVSTSFAECLLSLCMLCREAVNRAKIRRGSGLEAILALLNDASNERYHSMLLHALAQFICDDLSIEIMVKNGLVDVIVDKLRKISLNGRRNDDRSRDMKNRKKRIADTSPLGRGGDTKYNRTNSRYGRFSLDYPRVDWSPGGTSTSYSSPPSTPPLLVYDVNSDIDENADDNYSPICSDNEWLENDDTTDLQSDGELTVRGRIGVKRNDNDEEEEEEDNDDDDDFPKLENDENFGENCQENNEDEQESASTLALLSMLSHSSLPIERLSDSTTINALVGYIAAAKNNRASVILTRIIRNRAYFVPLVLQGFVFEAQTLHGAEHYTRALCSIAETGGAFGEIATILLRGKDSQKSVVAVSVPYVIKNREKLRILLNNHGGLELIYKIFGEPKNSIHKDAIFAVCKLAASLDITTPACDDSLKNHRINDIEKKNVSTNEKIHKETDETIIFELDDGSTVETRRTIICEKSQVFAAMLDGSFSESRKNHVRLKKTSNEGFRTMLMAADGNFHLESEKIESVLDAVILADKYLMNDISERLTEISIARIDHENICRAWTWSRINSCHELRNCCVKIFLTGEMSREQRLRAFRDFYETTNFGEFVKDTRDIIDDSLALSRI